MTERQFPLLSQHWFNSLVMYSCNNTEGFIRTNFSEAHDAFLRKEAQHRDTLNWERKLWTKLNKAEEAKAAASCSAQMAWDEKKRVEEEKLESTVLQLDATVIAAMTGDKLIEQINKHHWLAPKDTFIPNRTAVNKLWVGPWKALLQDIIKCYNAWSAESPGSAIWGTITGLFTYSFYNALILPIEHSVHTLHCTYIHTL